MTPMPHARTIAVLMLVSTVAASSCARVPAGQGDERGASRDVTVAAEVPGDLLRAGRDIRVEAPVRGDATTAGQTVVFNAPVDGYIIGAGRTVTVDGDVGNDVWLAGQTVRIASAVRNNATAAGQTVELGPRATVGSDARLAGDRVRSEAHVEHDLKISASRAEIGGEVGGAVHARADRVSILPGAVIHGDLVVRSPRPPAIDGTAQVMGGVSHERTGPAGLGGWLGYWIWTFLALLLIGLVVLVSFPAWMSRVSEVLRTRTGRSLGMGALILFGVPLGGMLLAMTIVGIPLAAILLGLYVAALGLALICAAYRVGQWSFTRLTRREGSRFTTMALGVLMVSLVVTLPAVGWLVALALILFGAGALALERRGAMQPS